MTPDDFQYVLENTRVVVAPSARIATFGQTTFRFHLVTELMDSVNEVRVRNGRIHAERPEIITPENLSRLLLEGFGDKARAFADWLESRGENAALLKYGFRFRQTDFSEEIVHSPVDEVLDRVAASLDPERDPLSAVIHGVDEGWEVCLLKFTFDMVKGSAGGNLGDFRKKGLL